MKEIKDRFSFSQNGCTLYFQKRAGMSYGANDVYCTGIDVEPGVKEVAFPGNVKCDGVELNKVMKQFPDVEVLRIGKGIRSMCISNYMFPNVRWVYSDSMYFVTGPYLMAGRVLCNTFCRAEDEEINLTNVCEIRKNALEGCRAKVGRISPTIRICETKCLEPMEYNSVSCLGNAVIAVDDADVALPDNITQIGEYIQFAENCKVTISLKSLGAFLKWAEEDRRRVIRDTIYSDESDMHHLIDLNIIMDSISGSERTQITSLLKQHFGLRIRNITVTENPALTTGDGIVYSKNGKRLLYCPQYKTGRVVIPEGVEEIVDEAFCNSLVSEVILPDSLREIGTNAFSQCSCLRSIDLNRVRTVGAGAFSMCMRLKKVNTGTQLEEVQFSAFESCRLLRELSFPPTLKKLGRKTCQNVDLQKLKFQGDLPETLLEAVCINTDAANYRHSNDIEGVIECEYPGGKFCIPRCVTDEKQTAVTEILRYCAPEDVVYSLHQYAYYNTAKYRCAIRTYALSHNEELARYLSRTASNVVNTIADDEKLLIEFVGFGLAGEKALQNALKLSQQKEQSSAQAYILNALNGKTKSFKL